MEAVYTELLQSFEEERWSDLRETLERVAKLGEKNGQREISIQAQSLRMSIENRARVTETTPFREMTDQFESLVMSLRNHLTHLAWTKEVSA
jgi:hypothetical protein